MFRTSNPILNPKSFSPTMNTGGEVMTIDGTVNKTMLALVITVLAASYTWMNPSMGRYYIAFIIAGAVIGIIQAFARTWAPILTPLYAAVEGAAMGSISLFFNQMYPGIVFQAVALTFGVLFCMLTAYRSGWIKVTDKFRLGLVAATGAIGLFYLVTFILSLCGVQLPIIYGNGAFSIGLSVVVVVVASLNLVLDFDFIESVAKQGNAPKYMEWFAAFGLIVTLIWLYFEILRLLAKLNSRRN